MIAQGKSRIELDGLIVAGQCLPGASQSVQCQPFVHVDHGRGRVKANTLLKGG